jgi:hypothetical protein
MSSETKLNAEQICVFAINRIRRFLVTPIEDCELIKDASGAYFVFRFIKHDGEVIWEKGRLTVLIEMIEDGIMSEREIAEGLWHTLGQIKGMV